MRVWIARRVWVSLLLVLLLFFFFSFRFLIAAANVTTQQIVMKSTADRDEVVAPQPALPLTSDDAPAFQPLPPSTSRPHP
jgi:hypothetical protein